MREPLDGLLPGRYRGGSNASASRSGSMRIGDARAAIAALFGGIMRLKHVSCSTRTSTSATRRPGRMGDRDALPGRQDMIILTGMMGMTMDPSLRPADRRQVRLRLHPAVRQCRRIPLTRCAAKVFAGPARFQSVELALASGRCSTRMVEALGSHDSREIAWGSTRCARRAARPRPRRTLPPGPLQAGHHRHRRRPLPRSQRRDVRFLSPSSMNEGIGHALPRKEDLRLVTGAAASATTSTCRARPMPAWCARRMRMPASARSTTRRRARRRACSRC